MDAMMPTSRNGLGHEFALDERGAYSEQELDNDEDEKQRVEHLDCGGLHAGLADAEQLAGGLHEHHQRSDDEQHRDAPVDDVLRQREHPICDAQVLWCIIAFAILVVHALAPSPRRRKFRIRRPTAHGADRPLAFRRLQPRAAW
jgi:hypothetical protein